MKKIIATFILFVSSTVVVGQTTTSGNTGAGAAGAGAAGAGAAGAGASATGGTNPQTGLPVDCTGRGISAGQAQGEDEVVTVHPLHLNTPITVLCSEEWIVIQSKFNNSGSLFNTTWEEYASGFGTIQMNGEFWLGNRIMHNLTTKYAGHQYALRVELLDEHDVEYLAVYSRFEIQNEEANFTLMVDGFQPDVPNVASTVKQAGNALNYHNSVPFSTWDRDSDIIKWASCSSVSNSGWWYLGCSAADLNRPTLMYWYGENPTTTVIAYHSKLKIKAFQVLNTTTAAPTIVVTTDSNTGLSGLWTTESPSNNVRTSTNVSGNAGSGSAVMTGSVANTAPTEATLTETSTTMSNNAGNGSAVMTGSVANTAPNEATSAGAGTSMGPESTTSGTGGSVQWSSSGTGGSPSWAGTGAGTWAGTGTGAATGSVMNTAPTDVPGGTTETDPAMGFESTTQGQGANAVNTTGGSTVEATTQFF